ncbi:MAG: glycosyltransferase [Pikeienuella sp.]
MIFLTLGTQLPFDRLTRALDEAAAGADEPVFGQIGKTGYRPAHFEFRDFISPAEFAEKFEAARVVVGHAGIGTILSGMRMEKPLILMARRAEFKEHRNDHQLATVAQMRKIPGIHVVDTAEEIRALLQRPDLPGIKGHEAPARMRLIESLRAEIFGAA